ncbi:MAG: DUF5723 family protein [Bacteroidales bacterium]|nr:DUF5723 family protein [Bacteroidales bacterium]
MFAFVAIQSLNYGKVQAQEMFGMVNSNFAGTSGLYINPSSMQNSRYWLDINILTLDVFADNNYAYLPREDFKLLDLLKKDFSLPTYGAYETPTLNKSGWGDRSFYISERLNLPSFMFVNYEQAYALQIAYRTAGSGRSVGNDITNFGFYGLNYKPQHNIEYNDNYSGFAALSWAEIGLSYSRQLKYERFTIIHGGVTLKRLLGMGGGYLNVDNLRYVVLNDSTVDIRNLTFEAAYSAPVDYATNEYQGDPLFKGSGFALDLGVTIIKTEKELRRFAHGDDFCEQEFQPYLYRLGISLLDVGWIKFRNNAQKHRLENVSYFWENLNFDNYNTLVDIMEDVSTRFTGASDGSLIDTTFSVGLPTALSAQFDYHYRGNWYFNTTAITGIPIFGNASVVRPTQISFTPRWESPYFEASLPISLYNLRYPRIGLALRFYNFTIGSDKLGSVLGFNDFYGTDIYFSLKINFRKGNCRKSRETLPCGSMDFK